jgi:LacI family transcriptional regulator
MQVIQALQKRGLSVPGDVSVIGHNDSPWAHRFDPAISSLRIPFEDMAETAVRLLLERIQHPGTPYRRELLAETLVVRESTGPAAGNG